MRLQPVVTPALDTDGVDKPCSRCGHPFVPTNFSLHKNGRRYPSSWCNPCRAEEARQRRQRDPDSARQYDRDYYWANVERMRAIYREWQRGQRVRAIERLGGACRWCGEDDPVVLELDHIDGTGWQYGRNRSSVAERQALAGDPNLQVLCANCHRRKTALDRKRAAESGKAR